MFESLRRLFTRTEPPLPVLEDSALGKLTWSADDEAWFGTLHGHVFSLGYQGTSTPSPEVRNYALRMLSDSSWLGNALAHTKTEALKTNSSFYAAEIDSLTLAAIHFHVHAQRGEYAIADLRGGKDFREWRIEFRGSTCDGIGFDS